MAKHNFSKRICTGALLLLLLFTWIAAPRASNASAYINGVLYPGTIHIQSGVSYLPMRHFLNHLGWEVDWDQASRTASARKGTQSIRANLPHHTLTVDGVTVDTKLLLLNGKLYLPLRTTCTFLGYSVSWNNAYKAVMIYNSTASDWSENDLYWLSRIISAEARGESLTGQIAVGNVVLNRVASPKYPGTIYDVIFDRNGGVQFEPVSNGTVYQNPTATSIQAAKLALQGVNVVGESMFFFNPDLSQGTWIVNNRTYYKTIGCHRFYL